jgi:hypothetical protein
MSEYYSISLEDFVNSNEDTLLIPPPTSPTRPTSPTNTEEYEQDWFDNLYNKLSEKKLKHDEPVQFSNSYNMTYSTSTPTSVSTPAPKYYTIPHRDSEAKRIWLSARIPKHATQGMIEIKLSQWVIDNADIIHTWDKSIVKWKTNSGYVCSSEWNTLVRWLICSTTNN